MAGKPVKVAFLADTSDLRSSLAQAETALDSAANEAKSAGAKMEAAFDGVGAGADGMASASSQAAGGIGDIAGALESTGLISEGTAAAMETASAAIMGVTGVSDLANLAFEKMKLGQIGAKIATVAQTAATTAQTAAQSALNAVMAANPIMLVVIAVAALVAGLVIAYKKSETFRDVVDKAWGAIKTATGAVFDWVRDKIDTVFGFLKNLFLNFTGPGLIIKHWDTIKEKTTGAWDAVRDTVRDKLDAAKTFVTDKLGAVVEFVGGLKEKVTSKAAGMWDGIRDSFKSVINSMIGWWNDLSFSINIPDKIPGLPDSFTISTPNIPELATGGIVTRPTLAVVGEAGPEAVIPLNGRYGVGTTIVNHFHVPALANPVETGREVQRVLDAYTRAGGRAFAS